MSSTRRAVWLLVLACLVPGAALAQKQARLIGKVLDPDGAPIAGVTVTATSPDVPSFREVATTDKKGLFIVDFRDVGVTYHYRFEKAGYTPLDVDQRWDLLGTARHQWTLQPTAPVTVASAPATASGPAVLAFNAGVAAVKARDYAMAEAKFGEAVRHDPTLAQAWAALGEVQVQTGRYEQAAASAEKAMSLGLRNEAVLTARWQAYRGLKDDARAAEALKDLEAVGRRAEEARRVHNEAVALVRAGNDTAAFAKFEEALSIDPALEPALLGLAAAGVKIGRHAEAERAAAAVLHADPGNEQAIRLRYNAALGLDDKDVLFAALVAMVPIDRAVATKGLMKLAFDAYDANDTARAREGFVKLLEIDPNQPLVHYYLALVYVNEGATDKARAHLERVVALAPAGQEAATAREMLKQLPRQ